MQALQAVDDWVASTISHGEPCAALGRSLRSLPTWSPSLGLSIHRSFANGLQGSRRCHPLHALPYAQETRNVREVIKMFARMREP